MAQVTVADIKLRDDYIGLTSAQKLAIDVAFDDIAITFATEPATAKQDNITSLFLEVVNQQVIA